MFNLNPKKLTSLSAQRRERNLNKNFSDVCNCFVDNKLSIHFGEQNVY